MNNALLLVVALLPVLLYLLLLLPPVWRFNRLPKTPVTETQLPAITVLIPARNEAVHLVQCINALVNQQTATGQPLAAELIVIDDHSADATVARVRTAFGDRVRVLHLPAGNTGKKAALVAGVAAATGTLIATTDADCTPPPLWLAALASTVHNTGAQLAHGPILPVGKNTLLTAVQQVESIAVQAVSAGLLQRGEVLTAGGASLCYPAGVLAATGNYANDKTPSGDDVLLLLRVQAQWPGSVRWVHDANALVPAAAANTLPDLLRQRIRWASKYKLYTSVHLRLLGSSVVLATVVPWLLLLMGFFYPPFAAAAALAWLAKFAADILLLSLAVSFFRKRSLLLWFLPAWILYQALAPCIAAGAFTGRFRWKDRNYQT